jgi:hypothetical protein
MVKKTALLCPFLSATGSPAERANFPAPNTLYLDATRVTDVGPGPPAGPMNPRTGRFENAEATGNCPVTFYRARPDVGSIPGHSPDEIRSPTP